VAAGAQRFVVVRFLTEAGEPGAAAKALRSAVDGALARARAVAPEPAAEGRSER
jgi:hypothetical protein